MTLKSLAKDLKDIKGNIGSMSKRTLDFRFSRNRRVRSQSMSLNVFPSPSDEETDEQSCWANLPSELLRDVLQRVESAKGAWPSRRDVVACSAVCRSWREMTKELVKTPEECGRITFPISLKQPGPRDAAMQCFIRRDRTTSTYYLYLGLSPSLLVENSKFLLAARKVRRATCTDYIVSLNADEMSRGSGSYVGKLRSNFLGTKFRVYDGQAPHSGAIATSNKASWRIGSKQVSPRFPAGSYDVAYIAYELNVLGTRGPRRMQCIMHHIPSTCLDPAAGGTVIPCPPPLQSSEEEDAFSSSSSSASKPYQSDMNGCSSSSKLHRPLVLKNKAPRWHEQLQCWCLNFRGRVTVASVKNFQLVACIPADQAVAQAEQDKVLLQFGKIGKDIFTMDYRYPLSAFQAFTICLSSFDTKLACE